MFEIEACDRRKNTVSFRKSVRRSGVFFWQA